MDTATTQTHTKTEAKAESAVGSTLFQAALACISVVSLGVSFLALRKHLDVEAATGLTTVFLLHELGHLAVARHQGLPSSWPMFIPNVGAFVLMLRPFKNPREEAYVALGGPVAGLAATAVLHGISIQRDSAALLDLTIFCYAIHLVNMIPAGMLDGGKIANLVCKPLWVPGLVALIWVAWKFCSGGWVESLVILLALWTAAGKALAVLRQRGQDTAPTPHFAERGDILRVAAIASGVVLFGLTGLYTARFQLDELICSKGFPNLDEECLKSFFTTTYTQIDPVTGQDDTPEEF